MRLANCQQPTGGAARGGWVRVGGERHHVVGGLRNMRNKTSSDFVVFIHDKNKSHNRQHLADEPHVPQDAPATRIARG